MIKKITLLLGIPVLLLALVSCDGNQSIVGIRQEAQTMDEMIVEFSLETIPVIRRYTDGPGEERRTGMTLTDLLTNEILETLNFGAALNTPNIDLYELRLGYYGIYSPGFGGTSFAEDGRMTFGIGDGDEWVDIPPATFKIFNINSKNFQESDVTDLQLILARYQSDFPLPVIYDDENFFMYYFIGNRIYTYNPLIHETSLVFEAEDDLRFNRIVLVDDERIAFLGQKIGSSYDYYGVINLANDEIIYDYANFPESGLSVYGNHLLLSGSWNEGVENTNEVIVFNLTTFESTLVQIDGSADLHETVGVIADRFVLVTTLDRIKAYDIATNQLVLDREPLIELRRDAEFFTRIFRFITVEEGLLYGIVFEIENPSLFNYEGFATSGKCFLHTEFIVIEEWLA